jgi:hypothetical protein
VGLDLYHLKPCATTAGNRSAINFALEEELAAAPAAFVEKHRHLLVQTPVPPDIFSIRFMTNFYIRWHAL